VPPDDVGACVTAAALDAGAGGVEGAAVEMEDATSA
jgi:hypothetical protein